MAPVISPSAPSLDLAPREAAVHRRVAVLGGLDLLRATYVSHAFPPHLHEEFAIGVIERGANALRCRGASHVAAAGCVVAINPGDIHTGVAAGPNGWSYRMLYPSVALMALAAGGERPARVPLFAAPVLDDALLAARLLRVHQLLEVSACPLEGESRLLDALRALVRRHATRGASASAGDDRAPAARHPAVRVVREYLETHYARRITLASLAALAGLSPYHLIRVFRAAVGLPPYAYLEQVRVARAQALLRAGHPVSAVAYATGYSDQSHLTRHFKRVVGVPPGQYQRGRIVA